ncbi:MAG TPA: pyridoxal phosphate-dependent aminotransferase family protein [Chloroflexota bacterium]|jgi:8-amino-7-oxononanoate synthase|nr:pyridoxal phosphate-dependent aminotransferase family protein [Chloroflexota bacterium]
MADLFAKCGMLIKPRQAEAMGCYPFFIPIGSEAGPEVIIQGRRMVMLGSNNYLGLTQDPRVKEAAQRAIAKYGSGCTGSRLMNGTLDLHRELEQRLAHFMRKEDALVFTTGFQTNLGTISALVGRHDTIVLDRSVHASIIDGCRLSLGETVRFKHNDMADLERVLQGIDPKRGILIIVDGVYSMEGDIANVPELVRLKKKYGARLMIDEAHAVGVFGDGGRGVAEYFGLLDEVDLITATFSKSFASIGGFVAGSKDVIYYIRHMARALLFSASLPPASAAAALAALDIIENEPERRERLWENTRFLQRGLKELRFSTGNSESPIIPLIVGDEMRLAWFWKGLFDGGVFTNAAVSPAVEPDRALIRTSLMATHTVDQLTYALEVMEATGKRQGLL